MTLTRFDPDHNSATGRRRTDLAVLAPHGWDATDPTWTERYTAAPDQSHPLVCDQLEDISPARYEATLVSGTTLVVRRTLPEAEPR